MTDDITKLNPWPDVPDADKHRTTILIPQKVYARLRQVEPKTGVLQTTIYQLLNKLVNELDRTGRFDWNPSDFWNALTTGQLVLPGQRSAAACAPTRMQPPRTEETPHRDDGRRTEPVARAVDGRTESSDATSNAARPSRRRKAGGEQQGK